MKLSVAVIGLGRVGSILLQQLLFHQEKGIEISAVSELNETPGRILAKRENLKICSIEDIANLGESVDIIFELTGQHPVRQKLRDELAIRKNHHSVIATETMASLICLMLSDKELPNVHQYVGY